MKIKWTTLGLAAAAFAVAVGDAAPERRGAPAAPARPTARPASPPRPAQAPNGKAAGARFVGHPVVPHPDRSVHATNNPPHQVIIHNPRSGRDERHQVIVDHRPGHIIDRDPHLRVIRRGYRPLHNWEHWHRAVGGWWAVWGITAWDEVGTVTCEAANEATGELYPVSEDRDDVAWDDAAVNTVLDQALDDCIQDAGTNTCVPTTPACTFQNN